LTKKCLYCGKEFTPKKNTVKFCSKSCGVKNRHPEDVGLFKNKLATKDIKAYLLGLLVTDGCITTNGNTGVISIGLNDLDMITKIRDLVCPTKKIYVLKEVHYQVKWKNSYDIKVLNKLGIKENKTLTAPFNNLGKNKWDYLRGILDGDGCVYNVTKLDKKSGREYKYTHIGIASASTTFCNGLMKFLSDNDLNPKLQYDKRGQGKTAIISIFPKAKVKSLYNHLYSENTEWKFDRKYEKFS